MRIPGKIAPLAEAPPGRWLPSVLDAALAGFSEPSVDLLGGGPPVSRSTGLIGALPRPPAAPPDDVVVKPPPGAIWFEAESIEEPPEPPPNISFRMVAMF